MTPTLFVLLCSASLVLSQGNWDKPSRDPNQPGTSSGSSQQRTTGPLPPAAESFRLSLEALAPSPSPIAEYRFANEPYEMRKLMEAFFEPGAVVCEERVEIRDKLKHFFHMSAMLLEYYQRVRDVILQSDPIHISSGHNSDYVALMGALQYFKSNRILQNPDAVEKIIEDKFHDFLIRAYDRFKNQALAYVDGNEKRRIEISQELNSRMIALKPRRHMTKDCREFLALVNSDIEVLNSILDRTHSTVMAEKMITYNIELPTYPQAVFNAISEFMAWEHLTSFESMYSTIRANFPAPLTADDIRKPLGVHDQPPPSNQ